MDAQSLVLFLDAVVNDNEPLMRLLVERFPVMAMPMVARTADEKKLISSATCDYLFMHEGTFGIVLTDDVGVRSLVSECDFGNAIIYWGRNSDPVEVCTVATIAKAMQASEKYNTPTNVLTYFQQLA